MHHSLWVAAVVSLLFGVLGIARPGAQLRLCSWQRTRSRIQARGVVLLIVGLFLIVASHYTTLGPFVMVIGFLLTLTGIVDLMAPSVEERLIDLWLKAPDILVRLWGVVLVVIGIVFVVAALAPGRWPARP
ncbi:hypothetical protein AMJ39_06665 [candidate division TA06 bacterium DG_24]|jgi:uncharacterized protein YjeT (DUF2065 family)|uniref:Uncharacterized protein n=3 Tax=Bacteria division TA06 TaxID=1156500 RepID=A0A0S8JL34_UNCT6|nr:MAG: hypothetical protein AMJ39_06665 [candidate division TA06 bacterium DG_24]KPK68968.1 MAG: hypothetical protein AMJ82_06865 [candidate division TA06 bacterium SM23_40]KPL10082.1 MAG: hypothetical protein AMJ71_04490 [candidate division TA06 bacterium SM1_40]